MKKLLFLVLCVFLIGGFALTNSCKKTDKIKGCTDKDSKNYNPSAQENDGSCLFEGAVVFWYDQAASTGLIGDSATSLTFYINGAIVGSTATTIFWAAAPTCGENGSITVTEDLGKVKTQAYTLSVKDQTGFEYWNASVNVAANTCIQFQLLWSSKKKSLEPKGINYLVTQSPLN